MTGSTSGGANAKKTQIENYGGLEGYSAEMRRRVNLRKTKFIPEGFRDKELAKRAVKQRWDLYEKRKASQGKDTLEVSHDRTQEV